jgi:hypothetical protein
MFYRKKDNHDAMLFAERIMDELYLDDGARGVKGDYLVTLGTSRQLIYKRDLFEAKYEPCEQVFPPES